MKAGEIYIHKNMAIVIQLLSYLGKDDWSVSVHHVESKKMKLSETIAAEMLSDGQDGKCRGAYIFKHYTKCKTIEISGK